MTSPLIASNQNDLIEIYKNFSSWLNSKSYQSSTIRNYLSDINAYFNFVKNLSLKISTIYDLSSTIYSPDSISAYLETIKSDSNYSRYLSSLSKFFQYTLDQNLITIDPLKQVRKVKKPTIDDVLSDYQSFLTKKHFSTSTIRNYLNDLRQFIDWNQTLLSSGHPPLMKGGNTSQTTAPLHQGELSNEERLKGFSFKSIFRKKEVSSES